MTANAFVLFSKNKDDIRLNDLVGANLRMALVGSAYTPNVTATGHSLWSEVSANEIAGANGYTTGGFTLTGAVAAVAGNDGAKLSSGNAAWTGTGAGIAAFRYAVMYYNGTIWTLVNPLIGYILCDNTPADIPATTPAVSPLTITCPATGWFDLV
jgi:hypothetical protein